MRCVRRRRSLSVTSAPAGLLILKDGTLYRGRLRGDASLTAWGEVIFHTGMTGYPEIFTDPSYHGQLVVMTYPHIGNYGIQAADVQSAKMHAQGIIVKEMSLQVSHWRSDADLEGFLRQHRRVALEDVDTRALTLAVRRRGSMAGLVAAAAEGAALDALIARARALPSMIGRALAPEVSTNEPYPWSPTRAETITTSAVPSRGTKKAAAEASLPTRTTEFSTTNFSTTNFSATNFSATETRWRVIAYDFGIKRDILLALQRRGVAVTVVPHDFPAEEVLARRPDGVFLSNGPGDPQPLRHSIAIIERLLGRVPIFGICLGHQLLCLALGGRAYKLKFGHHGANHPVLNLRSGRVEITSHNHGFAIAADSLPPGVTMTHRNLNDDTLEGIAAPKEHAFSVQYHPEACPGPHDARYLFDEFVQRLQNQAVS